MELNVRERPVLAHPRRATPRFADFTSFINAFGEFKLLADSSRIVIGMWAARRNRGLQGRKSIIGRPLREIFEAELLEQVEELTRRTAALNRRDEEEFCLTVTGAKRWFSVFALPVDSIAGAGSMIFLIARDVTHRVQTMEVLKEREALLAQAEQLANFGSWELDLKTNELKLSAQMRKIYELQPGQKWKEDTYWERVHPGDRERVRRLVDQSVKERRPFRFVARYCAPDGRVQVHLAHTLPIHDENGNLVRAIGVIQDVTEDAKSHRELRRLSQQLMNDQDTQRRHLARELHESAGQSLAALKMTLGRLREALPDGAELAGSLLESAALLADGAAREVRTVSYLLHPPMLDDAGLGPALLWYVKGFTKRSGISAMIKIDDPFPRYSQETETTVFRVVQEALTNVHRYSGSSTAEVRVAWDASRLRVEISDRGCGLPPADMHSRVRGGLGVGIAGMNERVKQLDGIFELNSTPGAGTIVRVILPASPLTMPREILSPEAQQSKYES